MLPSHGKENTSGILFPSHMIMGQTSKCMSHQQFEGTLQPLVVPNMQHQKGPATLPSIYGNLCICTWQQIALHCRISQSTSWEQHCNPNSSQCLQGSKFEGLMQVPNTWLLGVKHLCAWHQLGSAQHLLLRAELG